MILALFLGCGPTQADYARLERRVEALEARAREEATAKAEAARAAAAPPAPPSEKEHAAKLLGELQLIGQPAPPLQVSGWLQGSGELGTTLLVFFPLAADAAPALTRVQTVVARRVPIVGVTPGTDAAWLTTHRVGFPVATDAEGATAAAYRRSGPVSAVLVKGGKVVWTGTPDGLDPAVLDKHL